MNKLSIYILNVEECFTLNERLLDIFKTELVEEAVVNEVAPHLIELNTDLSVILSRVDNSEITRELAEKDKARNAAFISFRDYCNAFVKEPNPEQSAAAKKLTKRIRQIGWTLYNHGYVEQTASQEALIKTLAEPEYADAVDEIKATARVKNLKATNEAFEAAVKRKNKLTSGEKVPTVVECKGKMVKYLKPLLDYLELMGEIKPEVYATTMARINEAIEYVSTSAKARRTRSENLQAEEEEMNVTNAA